MPNIKIQRTSEIPFNGVKVVVYGGAGVGKTRLCATAPKPVIISAESGLLSLQDEEVDFIEINTLDDLNEAYNYLKANQDYQTICLDSLSEIAEVLILKIKPNYKDKRQAYNELADKMLPMLKNFRDLKGYNTVFTAKMIPIKDEESGRITQEIFMPGKVLPNQIPFLVDELFLLEISKDGKQTMHTSPTRQAFCKDRSGALNKAEIEPNMTDIIERIKAKVAK